MPGTMEIAMAPRARRFLFLGLVLPLLALGACGRARRLAAPLPGSATCLPRLEAPEPVGTTTAEAVSHDFVLRVHDVRDILDLMPVVQLVEPGKTTTVPPEDRLVSALLDELEPVDRVAIELSATDSGAVIVKASVTVQEQIAEALHRYRTDLVRGRTADVLPGLPSGR